MASSIADIIEGNGGRLTSRGWEFTRIFIVKDLLGEGYAMIKNSVETFGVPVRGDPHPAVPDAFVIDLNPVHIPTANNQVRITILYRENEAGQTRYALSGTPAFVETPQFYDQVALGYVDMELKYTYAANYPNPDYAGLLITTGHKMSVLQPRPTIRITRFETTTISADAIPSIPIHAKDFISRQENYVGHVNAASWNLLPTGTAGAWLCTDIVAVKIPDQITWQVVYTFQFDLYSWTELAQFKDFNTGQIPGDLLTNDSAPDSQKSYTRYPFANFSKLELEW